MCVWVQFILILIVNPQHSIAQHSKLFRNMVYSECTVCIVHTIALDRVIVFYGMYGAYYVEPYCSMLCGVCGLHVLICWLLNASMAFAVMSPISLSVL